MKETEDISGVDRQNKKLVQSKKEEEVKKIIRSQSSSDTYLDLASKSILVIPEELFMLANIEYLYLESNHLEELPDDFFDNLPMLKWLDLRDNRLEYIPPGIGSHRYLKSLLLEKNQLTHLPFELGNVHTITGLSLRGNPLIIPPPEIVEQGVQVILSYLLDELNAGGGTSERGEESDWEYQDEGYLEDDDDRLSIYSSQSGIQQFKNGMGLHGPTPVPVKFHHPRPRNRKHYSSWKEKKGKESFSSTSVKVNQLNLGNSNQNKKRLEQQMERKNWLSKMQQKRQDTMVLDEWRKEAKRLQSILLPKTKTDEKRSVPPYGIDATDEPRPVTEQERQIHFDVVEDKVDRVEPKNSKPKFVSKEEDMLSINMPTLAHDIPGIYAVRCEEKNQENKKNRSHSDQEIRSERAAAKQSEKATVVQRGRMDSEVKQRIRQHTSQLRFQNQRNKKDNILQPGRELQRELLDQKMSRDPDLEYRFRAFTGDSSSFSSSKKTSSL